MGIIGKIKQQAAKSGQNKEKILYVKSDEKVRVRFLQEIDDGAEYIFHDSFADKIDAVCLESIGKSCPLCDNDNLRTRGKFAWSVWNYDTKKVEVALFAVNQCTPVSALVNLAETYNTIMDRDYVLHKTGKQQSTSYTVIPMDKNKFKNDKAKPYSAEAVAKILVKAYPAQELNDSDDDYEEDEAPKKKSAKGKKSSKKGYAALNDDETDAQLEIDWMEEQLDEEDIDVDDFCDFLEVKSLKKLKGKTDKQFMKLIFKYLDSLDEDDEDDDDDED